MKAQILISKIVLILMIIVTAFYLNSVVWAADVENCNLCHKYSGLGRIDENGKKRLFYVNEASYNHSAHGRLRCKDCHVNIEKFPHVDLEKVDCATECHLVEPSVEKKFSHAKMIEDYEQSVHGKQDAQGNLKENVEDLPTCTYCHENRILEPFAFVKGKTGVSQEILGRCLGCHEDEGWTKTYYSHLTHRLKQRRSSKKMVELCASATRMRKR